MARGRRCHADRLSRREVSREPCALCHGSRRPTARGPGGRYSATGGRRRLQPRSAVASGRSGAAFGPCAKRGRSTSDGGCDRAKRRMCFTHRRLAMSREDATRARRMAALMSYLTSGLVSYQASYQASGLIQNHVQNYQGNQRGSTGEAPRASCVSAAGIAGLINPNTGRSAMSATTSQQ